ncbi:unnamed protein product [Kuraishia capsulata CBS 1993]|uniref:2-dehydropantoate 2-reductase n=1 Tax=Kuraishia capsulata CBS 1993 TaxID=1382522 RepID=W6MIK9_9ASCO|nr:uncharacterized protein KUCA_T00001957001 [Kuraishia capsulata CBS 1993]CDK25986.1 unnamed protein product [Kuraishia capsulata CBS 1993]
MVKVYLLGAGCIGSLVANEVIHASKGSLEIVSLLRTQAKVDQFIANGCKITIDRLYSGEISTSILSGAQLSTLPPASHIDYLMVSVKTPATVASLRGLLPAISPKTKILLIQNGMGVVEELYRRLWPDPITRPTIFQAVIGHGVYQDPKATDPFRFSQAGSGQVKVALVPRELGNVDGKDTSVSPQFAEDPVIQSLVAAPELSTSLHSYPQFVLLQVRKFLLNSCINPTGSILDCLNGEMDPLDETRDLFRSIIAESIEVLLQARPFLKETPGIEEAFDLEQALEYVVEYGMVLNKQNSCSMRQDCLNLKEIEIDYINGFIVTLAEELGRSAPVNRTMTYLAKNRLALNKLRVKS